MRRIFGLYLFTFVGVFALVTPASAQVVKVVTDFEAASLPAGAQPFFAEVIFRDPQLSGSTRGITSIGVVQAGTYLTSTLAPPPYTETHSGTQSLVSFWGWENPGDHTSWVRLTSNDTEFIPNPSIHLGGKVRMWLAANAWADDDLNLGSLTSTGNLLVGMGVRETGLGVPLGGDGDVVGDIEWVGLSNYLREITSGTNGICDTVSSNGTDDVQLVPMGMAAANGGACVDAGTDGIMQTTALGDDVFLATPVGVFSVPTDGVMRLYEFDLPMMESNGEVVGLSGDGILGATPNNRGVLEHLAITNDPANLAAGANFIYFFVDDVEFEAPVPSPPTIVTNPPPRPLDESVALDNIDASADLVEIIQLPSTTLFSVDPMGATSMVASTGILPALIQLIARQRVGGVFSDDSSPVLVQSLGNAPLRLTASVRETDEFDHGLMCGDSGSGFNQSGAALLEFVGTTTKSGFGIPDGRTFSPDPDWQEVTFDPCVDGMTNYSDPPANGMIDLNTNGVPPPAGDTVAVWSDVFFRIDDTLPSQGPFTIYIDDLTIKNADSNGMDCLVDDFESYTPGEFIVQSFDGNGQADTMAVPDDIQVIMVGNAASNGQIIVAPGPNGVLDTTTNGDDVISALRARFQLPGVAGGSIGLAADPDLTAVTSERAFVGSNSLKIEFGFLDTANLSNQLRLTTNVNVGADAPETFLHPNTVIPVEFFPCDDGQDAVMSFMMLLEPPPVPGDCNFDGDIDLEDAGCFQLCMGQSPVQPECEKVSLAPNGAPDNVIDLDDYELFNFLVTGPK